MQYLFKFIIVVLISISVQILLNEPSPGDDLERVKMVAISPSALTKAKMATIKTIDARGNPVKPEFVQMQAIQFSTDLATALKVYETSGFIVLNRDKNLLTMDPNLDVTADVARMMGIELDYEAKTLSDSILTNYNNRTKTGN